MKAYRSRRESAAIRDALLEEYLRSSIIGLKRRLLKSARALLLVFVGLAAGLLLMEAALRVFGYQLRPLRWDQLLKADPDIAIHPRRIWTSDRSLDGIRGPAESAAAPRKMILFLGDPFIGQPVRGGQKSIPEILKEKLGLEDAAVYDVWVAGYGPEQEHSFVMESVLPRFRPDLIVWSFDDGDYKRMHSLSLYLRTKDSLEYLPAVFQGLYLQGVFHDTILNGFPGSRALNLIARSLEKMNMVSFFVAGNDNEITLLINRMVDDFAQRGVTVVAVRAPEHWAIARMDEYRKWRFFNNAGRLLPHFLDANEAIARSIAGAAKKKKKPALFESETVLSNEGRIYYADAISDYVAERGLLTNP